MIPFPKLTRLAICTASVILPLATASADQLNWDLYNTTANPVTVGLTTSYNIGSTRVTVAISGNTSEVTTTTSGGPYTAPAIGKEFTGGIATPENTLELAADFSARTNSLIVTVSFTNLAGTQAVNVNGLNFAIFDVDAGETTSPNTTYIDQIRGIQAILGQTAVNPISVTGTSGGNTVSGSGANFVVTGVGPIDNTTGGANMNINFGTQALNSFTFTWGDDTANAPTNPVRQVIGLHDINFTPVPEPGTVSMFALAAVMVGTVVLRRHSSVVG